MNQFNFMLNFGSEESFRPHLKKEIKSEFNVYSESNSIFG